MNDFLSLLNQAQEAWDRLEHASDPVIYIGMGSCGIASGAGRIWDRAGELIQQSNLPAKLVRVGCIGPCYLEPLVDIQKPGLPRVCFNNVDEKRLEKLIPD